MSPAGRKLWRLRYRFGGKEKLLALGKYPEVRAPETRKRATQARHDLVDGRDPSAEEKIAKERSRVAAGNSFEAVARQWHAKVAPTLAPITRTKHLAYLVGDVFPWIGDKPIAELSASDLVAVLRRIEGRGAFDIARRARNLCGRVFRYAVAHGLCERNPSRDIELRDILHAPATRHHASITDPKEGGEDLLVHGRPELWQPRRGRPGHVVMRLAGRGPRSLDGTYRIVLRSASRTKHHGRMPQGLDISPYGAEGGQGVVTSHLAHRLLGPVWNSSRTSTAGGKRQPTFSASATISLRTGMSTRHTQSGTSSAKRWR